MIISPQKLKAILLYFSNCTDTKYLGKVKLMKLFYFLDFMHVKAYGTPITYDTYVNLEHGPIPSTIKNIIDNAADDLENSILSDTIYFERPSGTSMHRVMPIREFSKEDEKLFSQHELEILKKVCVRFGSKTTREVEQASHDEAPWKETKYLQTIPYALAARDKDSRLSEEELALLDAVSFEQ
jgi:uncharacterized phage-associated protein